MSDVLMAVDVLSRMRDAHRAAKFLHGDRFDTLAAPYKTVLLERQARDRSSLIGALVAIGAAVPESDGVTLLWLFAAACELLALDKPIRAQVPMASPAVWP